MTSIEVPVYIAIGWDGKPRPWTIRPTRTATMEQAGYTMLGAREYHELGTTSARWKALYREGARIHKATLTLRQEKPE
jgi:hypothetical protein